MAYVTKEQTRQAKQLDLLSYLQTFEPQELVLLSRGLYSTKTHDSVIIRNGAWFRNSTGDYGFTALDYLVKVNGIPFIQAVETLSGERARESAKQKNVYYQPKLPEEKKLKLPPKHYNDKTAVAYLKSRGISQDLIGFCQRTGRLYESRYDHSPVFVGLDSKGKPRHAVMRHLTVDHRKRFKEAPGSDKRYSFSIPALQESRQLIVFESAIDLLSYCALCEMAGKDWTGCHLLSLSGIYVPQHGKVFIKPAALEHYLQAYPNIKKISLLLDGDEKGRSAASEIYQAYEKEYLVNTIPLPDGMDVNDVLSSCIKTEKRKEKKVEQEYIPA